MPVHVPDRTFHRFSASKYVGSTFLTNIEYTDRINCETFRQVAPSYIPSGENTQGLWSWITATTASAAAAAAAAMRCYRAFP